jgi:unsaturated chondroitin disaccharide hydrolase
MPGPIASAVDFEPSITAAVRELTTSLELFGDAFPGDTTEHGAYRLRPAGAGVAEGGNSGWTTGFWSGMQWLAYERTGSPALRQAAECTVDSFATRIETDTDCDTHDLGFLYTLSGVAAWRLTGNQRARQMALDAADRLMTRFIPRAGVFQAWGTLDDPQQRGRVIIDSLMNMPLLHWATAQTGDPGYADAAHRHVLRLRDQIIRPDDSTFHTFYFDPESGEPLHGDTAQGLSDDSCWARGQAWGILGFALNAKATGDRSLLDASRRLADYYLRHLPADDVPYWDLSVKHESTQYRDSSAAAIAGCGLLELGEALGEPRLRLAAESMLGSLASDYTPNTPQPGAPLLEHAVYNLPEGAGVDEGCLWGDYFYLEGLVRLADPEWHPYWRS